MREVSHLSKAKERFLRLLESSYDHYVSPRLTKQFEGNYEKGHGLFAIWLEDEVVHPEDREKLEQFTLQAPVRDYSELTLRLKTRQNGYIWCKIALSRLYDTEGRLLRYLGTLNDVDQATRSLNSLRYRAEYDSLSGVLNMRTFICGDGKVSPPNPAKPGTGGHKKGIAQNAEANLWVIQGLAAPARSLACRYLAASPHPEAMHDIRLF